MFLFIILFFLARLLIKNLHLFFFLITKNKNISIQLLSWFLIPGIVIHELSHFLIATLLNVRTGEFNFTPEILENNRIRAGGLKIAKTGPLRQTLIGLAPILIGLGLIYYLSYLDISNTYLLIAGYYLIFAVSNTMFSSRKDLETVLFPIILITLTAGALWLGRFQISFSDQFLSFVNSLFENINFSLKLAVLIDLGVLTILKALLFIKQRLILKS